ncbi:histamine H2 receptor-like [Asterias rubens]|uniref:histamine H2 receptor-like n=1 Tax=Asterias rubens TaxID=7604 RepID=UPI001454FD67|nr:histamine H2 receptor-like [Asterias rubens]
MDNFTNLTLDGTQQNTSSTSEVSSDGTTVLLLVVYGIIGSVGVVGNTVVILVYTRSPSFMRNVTSSIVCNQSAIDLAMSLVFLTINLGPKISIPTDEFAASLLCKLWISEYAIWALGASSTCNLVYLTIERYIAVFHPFYYRSKFTLRKARLLCVLPWVIGPIHELGWGLTNHVTNGTCSAKWPSVALNRTVGFVSLIDHYVIPLCVMTFVYSRIIYKLHKASRRADMGLASSRTRKRLVQQASRNVIITTFLVSLTYLICWGPNELMYFYVNMGGDVNMGGVLFRSSVVMALVNMCVNPFIYAMCYKDFRRGFWVCLGRKHAMYNAPYGSPTQSHEHEIMSTTVHCGHEVRRVVHDTQQTAF